MRPPRARRSCRQQIGIEVAGNGVPRIHLHQLVRDLSRVEVLALGQQGFPGAVLGIRKQMTRLIQGAATVRNNVIFNVDGKCSNFSSTTRGELWVTWFIYY